MRNLIYSMTVSLDGFTADPSGAIDWSTPDDELHQFHNDQVRELGVHLCGRRLFDEMTYWDTATQDPDLGDVPREFAAIWQQLPKIVFSTTRSAVDGNARLATGTPAEEIARLKAEPGGDLAVGGPGLAAACIADDLVDEYRLFVSPIVLGGGTPYFPPLARRLDLELVETRAFAAPVQYLRYRRRR